MPDNVAELLDALALFEEATPRLATKADWVTFANSQNITCQDELLDLWDWDYTTSPKLPQLATYVQHWIRYFDSDGIEHYTNIIKG